MRGETVTNSLTLSLVISISHEGIPVLGAWRPIVAPVIR